jgi:geranylgeranyl diphosphate synthase type I
VPSRVLDSYHGIEVGVPKVLELYRAELLAELRSIIGDNNLPLYDMMRYHLGWIANSDLPQPERGGNLWRPFLCLFACQAVGGGWQKALPAAVAVELVHNFSLIHDDVEDASSERRHHLTLWKVWGQAQAINTGDAMHALAQLSLFRLESRGIPGRKMLKAAEALDKACLQLCQGQYLDLSFESQIDTSVADCLKMIALKTASLFETSLYVGALLGIDEPAVIDQLCGFGRDLGMAYQMRDDLLGIWGSPELTGKPRLEDIRRRKKTLPVVYGLEKDKAEGGEGLLRLYQQETIEEEDATKVASLLDEMGARRYTEGMLEQYYHQALSHLEANSLASQANLRGLAALILGEKQ